MADGVEFSITGLDSLIGKLDAVSYDIRRRGGRSALRKAAQVVVQKAKEGAEGIDDPVTRAHIAENITLRWSARRFKATGDLMFRVGVMGGAGGKASGDQYAGLPGGDTRHWRHVEFGTEDTAAHPFMRNALANSINEVTNTFVTEYEKAIDRAIRRAAKKAASS